MGTKVKLLAVTVAIPFGYVPSDTGPVESKTRSSALLERIYGQRNVAECALYLKYQCAFGPFGTAVSVPVKTPVAAMPIERIRAPRAPVAEGTFAGVP